MRRPTFVQRANREASHSLAPTPEPLRSMIPTRGELARRFVGLLLAAAAGCYSPNIVSGGLLCATGTSACPDGFTCVGTVCLRPDAAVPDLVQDRQTDTPPSDHPAEKPPSDGSGDGPICVLPVMGCTPQTTSGCDPVCQVGCCGSVPKKCSVAHDETIACLPLQGSATTWNPCTIQYYDQANQNDTCTPGDICLRPGGPESSGDFCFPLCRNDDDCTVPYGSACVERPIGGTDALQHTPMAKVCDVPFVDCDPQAQTSSCPANRPYCYLYTPNPTTKADRTVCEFAPGTLGNNQPCMSARDCFPRWTCPTGNVTGANVCHPICDVATNNCAQGTHCVTNWGTKYGYCISP